MHWQQKMYYYGFERFHTMLGKYPKTKLVGHAQTWWAYIDKNRTDQAMLYPKGKATPGGLTQSAARRASGARKTVTRNPGIG
jgi:hypothetical protein